MMNYMYNSVIINKIKFCQAVYVIKFVQSRRPELGLLALSLLRVRHVAPGPMLNYSSHCHLEEIFERIRGARATMGWRIHV